MALKIKGKSYTFDDLMIIPRKSHAKSRKNIDVSSFLTKNIKINIPIISANMIDVTGIKMAMEMSRLGAVGALHRYMPVTTNANYVWELKKNNFIAIGSIGIIRREELSIYSPDDSDKLIDYDKIVEAHDEKNISKYTKNELCRFASLSKQRVDVIIIDIAHAHSDLISETLAVIRCLHESKDYMKYVGGHKPDIIVGNVSTGKAIKDFMESEYSDMISAWKIGQGPGSACTTRIVTGCGVPQLTAISECADVANQYQVPVIADGGIKYSGDITKALAAGASSVMIGGIFAGCEETPGEIIREGQGGQKKFKLFRGMASIDSNVEWRGADPSSIVPEGVSTLVPYKGPVSEVLFSLVGGLQSGMSYSGASCIEELREVEFYEQSPAGVLEARPHGAR